MTPPVEGSSTVARLSPFAFPSDTDSRLALLVGSVLAATLTTASLFHLTLWGRQFFDGFQLCSAAAQAATPQGASPEPDNTYQAILTGCFAQYQLPVALTMIGAVVLVLAAAAAVVWLYPVLQTRRDRLQPLTAADAPEVLACLLSLSEESGLPRIPAFIWDPMDGRASAYAYGSFGRHYVALSGGLATKFYADRASFRAILLHELGHLRNADVGKAAFAKVIPWVFAAVVLLPFAVSQITTFAGRFAENGRWRWELAARVAVLPALLYLSRNAVLRAREYYADARASRQSDDRAVLSRLLATWSSPPQTRWRALALGRFHPTTADRLRALADPRHLFRAGLPEASLTGVTLGIGLPSAVTLMTYLWNSISGILPFLVSGEGVTLGAALPFCLLAAGVVGIGVWRETFAARLYAQPATSAARLALALQAGFLVGLLLSPDTAIQAESAPAVTVPAIAFTVSWNVALFLGLWLYLRWVMAVAANWVDAAASGHTGVATFWLSIAAAGVVLAVLIAEFFLVRGLSVGILSLSATGSDVLGALPSVLVVLPVMRLYSALSAPGIMVTLVILWALPLATWWVRWRPDTDAPLSWAFWQPVEVVASGKGDHRRSAGIALGAAAICGFLAANLVINTVAYWRAHPAAGELGVLVPLSIYASGASAGVVAAVVTASLARRCQVFYGLSAAFSSGIVAVATVAAYRSVTGQELSGDALLLMCMYVANGAMLLGLPIIVAIALLRPARRSGSGGKDVPLLAAAPDYY